ncbi:MAG: Fe-S-containing hydro-lyase [Nitrospirae bacterium]|nr:Fe-S-containing hydro-lyase [Nitrospirota bacterium]
MKELKIKSPLTGEEIKRLKAGDKVFISGILYTARDAAHQRLKETIDKGDDLPIALQNQVIYYTGPTPAPPGHPLGSCGPTTSSRMDSFTPLLLREGLKGMIGKGDRSSEVIQAIQKYQAIYFIAIGGAGALLAGAVRQAEVIAYDDLGPEAIYRLEVVDFPVFVAIDCEGRNIYNKS